ncbi:telomere zinc finger-associated protein isoform X3 [Pipra filicauda]|uniref:Telomere zinc finger-associated protein isoform X3 n=1 Tax=Pipra filicauda TaxID=649802 RepID=A0A7R5KUY9_9PASS|nr:telomere zinc finger-associated protein isoform X3 [Pipra filicauda]
MLPPAPLRLCLCAAAAAAAATLSLPGDYRLAGLFPLHSAGPRTDASPLARGCDDNAVFKSHGYCLSQALRFTIEEINNSSTLLPNVTLGYDIHDTCSEPANLHATLSALIRKGRQDVQLLPTLQHYEPQAVAVIGPDSTQLALTTAAILGIFLVPEISYEASVETLSLKRLYPSFLRTIPSDRQQVKAIFLLLQHFGWTWVALLGSDNTYGRGGLDALQKLLTTSDVCVAYRGTIPINSDTSNPELHNMVRLLTDAKVNVTIIFSNSRSARPFFEVVVQRNITGMVWVGSEDWLLSQIIWQVPGIQTIGTVIGMTVEKPESVMLERFESWKMVEEGAAAKCASTAEAGGESGGSCTQHYTSCRSLTAAPNVFDAQASFNVYSAVYAVAHGLHNLLGCASGACSKGTIYPWQLLQQIRQVNFTLYKSRVSFDTSGDICKGYDIVMWNWSGSSWASDVIGTFHVNPDRLSIDPGKVLWHTKDSQAPTSVCSKACKPGEWRLQQTRHRCCFSCTACPLGTFLNRSDPYGCQHCRLDEWAPAGSEACFIRTVEFLSWSEPLSWVLLTLAALLMLLMVALAILFALNASTPVVKSAGGKMCFVMLGSLACTCSSLFCYFGEPTRLACLLRVPLFAVSFTVFLSCVATRSFQILCIFKLNARCPALYEAWLRRQGPLLFVAGSTAAQAMLCLAAEVTGPSVPLRDYGAQPDRVMLECAQSAAAGAATAYTVLLSVGCFALSYAGTDLPAGYNEAKGLTVSLLLHLGFSAAVLCSQGALRGRAEAAAKVLGALGTLGALLGGYFVPRAFVILLRPQQNTAEHFQMAIQAYTRRWAAA